MATGIDSQFSWNLMSSSHDWRLAGSTIPPPIPVRTRSRHDQSLFTAETRESEAYLSPLRDCQHLETVILPVADNGLCPPLPPRQPLQRSLSLTHRPPPQPSEDLELSEHRQQAVADMFNALRLARRQRPVQLTPAASAPLLSQVVPISRWPIREPSAQPVSPVRVIPLARWPLVDTAVTRRLAMDGIVSRGATGNGNEYVEGPSSSTRDNCGQRRRPRHKVTTTSRTATASAELTDSSDFQPVAATADVISAQSAEPNADENGGRVGFAKKLQRMLLCGGGTSGDGVRDTSATEDNCRRNGSSTGLSGTVCRRCGQCRCTECLRAEESVTLCRARTVVDTVTCMCCVRSMFYHCSKDDAGQDDDCSDAPCACCERPHCAMRWTVMTLLLPCLPCLCLYPPLSCTVNAMCRRRHASRACRCARRSRSSGLKSLLESESSSA